MLCSLLITTLASNQNIQHVPSSRPKNIQDQDETDAGGGLAETVMHCLHASVQPGVLKELTKLLSRHCSQKYLFRSSQDEDETDEAGGSVEALHRALLPRLPLHLHDVRPHAQACHAKIGVSSLCPGSVFFLALAKYKY